MSESKTLKRCDLCNGTEFKTIAERDRKRKPLETVICCDCGLVCHAQIPSEQELAAFYATDYRQQYHREVSPSNRRVMRAWNNGVRIFRQTSRFIDQDKKVFEVGAGIGCTVRIFELNGWDASGIEPNEGFQSYSQSQLKARVRNGNLYDQPKNADYDFVLLIHVVEHFCSPSRALKHIRGMIPHGGRFYVECPNITASFATRNKMFHYAHIHNFSASTLQAMAARCGFRLIKQLNKADETNLRVLFEAADADETAMPSNGYDETIAALRKYSVLSYHLRPTYLRTRALKVASYVREFASSKSFVSTLEKQSRGFNKAA